ncbi:MAG: leucyl aminopeptidase family protein [Pseudomonadota bacterium]
MPLIAEAPSAIPLHLVEPDGLDVWLDSVAPAHRAWAQANGFRAALGETLCFPDESGGLALAVLGIGSQATRKRDRFPLASAADRLPPGTYRVAGAPGLELDEELEALGWVLGQYRFTRYRKSEAAQPDLIVPEGVDEARIKAIAEGASLCCDLINTPARDMGPAALETAFVGLAERYSAQTGIIRGSEALVGENFPMIATVGAAASDEPRLLDMTWGRSDAPKITLVGKGVCFDTGGLNIKPGGSMGLMKKDMGGAATALGLAQIVMALGLDIRLRVLIPAVENSISAPAFRPGDILPSRKGLTVEVNNTDAEGRLVLADALALAEEEDPDLIVSLATLTGAARVALGPDVPPFYTDDDGLAEALSEASRTVADPLWRLPFWDPYEPLIEPGIADLDNAPKGGMAGSITAALFLRRFVKPDRPYIHFDIYGWTPSAKPGRPKGGAFQGARALLALLEARYCAPS